MKMSSLPRSARDHAHGIVEDDARLQRDVVIHDAEGVTLGELHADCAERGIRNPRIAVLPDLRAHQPRRPARQILRVGRERCTPAGGRAMCTPMCWTSCMAPLLATRRPRHRARPSPATPPSATASTLPLHTASRHREGRVAMPQHEHAVRSRQGSFVRRQHGPRASGRRGRLPPHSRAGRPEIDRPAGSFGLWKAILRSSHLLRHV